MSRSLPSKFSQIFRTLAGAKFHAELTFAASEGQESFLAPRRFLTVNRNSVATAGSVVVSPIGDKFLLASHVNYTNVSVLKAYSVDSSPTWTRTVTVTDAATGLQRKGVPVSAGTLWITLEPLREVKDFEISSDIFQFITGQNVLVGDLVDGKRVVRVLDQIGLKVCEVG